jgi:metal-sulfur cluster biosynthetic enzyme
MKDIGELRAAILNRLSAVIDPETGVDVARMRLIEDLAVDESGRVSYKFRPSSPLCPIAIPLAQMIKAAVSQVPGVTGQTIEVTDYVQAALLTQLLNLKP